MCYAWSHRDGDHSRGLSEGTRSVPSPIPGRSTSIVALWRTAWVHGSACWAVAVERWGRGERQQDVGKGCCHLLSVT